jgi:cation diffusion facilitator family transporter
LTQLLLRLFLRGADLHEASARARCGKLAGLVGIVCNVLLCCAKLIVGAFSGSVSIMADALNNLSDASSSVVTLLGFKLAEQPADAEHPYGHARMEYISGLIVAGLILVIGAELARSSFTRILHPEPVEFSVALVIVLIGSILLKLWMALFNRTVGRKIQSETLIATAADSRNDVITTAVVLLCCILGRATGLMIDGWAGLAVAAFILVSGVGIARDTINPLLGSAPDSALMHEVADEILRHDKVLGLHDLMVHDYGPGRRFGSVHVEMAANEDPLVCHEIIDGIEREFKEHHSLDLVIHYDPITTDDEELSRMHALVSQLCTEIDPRLSIHDFRMVRGTKSSTLIFDMVLPFDLQPNAAQIKQALDARLNEGETQYKTVITFDEAAFNL